MNKLLTILGLVFFGLNQAVVPSYGCSLTTSGTVCGNNGICTSFGFCECFDNFGGLNCETSELNRLHTHLHLLHTGDYTWSVDFDHFNVAFSAFGHFCVSFWFSAGEIFAPQFFENKNRNFGGFELLVLSEMWQQKTKYVQ